MPSRNKFARLAMKLDDAISSVMTALEDSELMDNTYVIISSDNGGCYTTGSLNLPLRGYKDTLFEGGIRNNAFIYSELLSDELIGTEYNNLFHISDWFPTIIEGMLGQELNLDYEIDGVNHWDTVLSLTYVVPRDEIIHDINRYSDKGGTIAKAKPKFAVRKGDYKLIYSQSDSIGWYNVSTGDSLCVDIVDYEYVHMFDISSDPYETKNLYLSSEFESDYSEIFDELWKLFEKYNETLADPIYAATDLTAAQIVWDENNYVIVPWE